MKDLDNQLIDRIDDLLGGELSEGKRWSASNPNLEDVLRAIDKMGQSEFYAVTPDGKFVEPNQYGMAEIGIYWMMGKDLPSQSRETKKVIWEIIKKTRE
jgi:hypothetical protein